MDKGAIQGTHKDIPIHKKLKNLKITLFDSESRGCIVYVPPKNLKISGPFYTWTVDEFSSRLNRLNCYCFQLIYYNRDIDSIWKEEDISCFHFTCIADYRIPFAKKQIITKDCTEKDLEKLFTFDFAGFL